jgi:hypothetical protein
VEHEANVRRTGDDAEAGVGAVFVSAADECRECRTSKSAGERRVIGVLGVKSILRIFL